MRFWSRSRATAPTPTPPARSENGHRAIYAPRQIAQLLHDLLETRALLGVGISSSKNIHASAILEVVDAQRYCVLDQFSPRIALNDETTNMRISVSTTLRGAPLRFSSSVSDCGAENGLEYYKVPFPEFIEYAQRRGFQRLALPLERSAMIELHDHNDRTYRGDVFDVSLGGMSARLDPGVVPGFRAQDLLPGATLYVAGQPHALGPVEICHCESSPAQPRARIGIRFVALPPRSERALGEFIAALDRARVRRSFVH